MTFLLRRCSGAGDGAGGGAPIDGGGRVAAAGSPAKGHSDGTVGREGAAFGTFDVRYRDGVVVERGDLEPRPDDQVVELAGAWLVPGLVDAHVHLALGGDLDDNLARSLAAGITAVRDMGAQWPAEEARRGALGGAATDGAAAAGLGAAGRRGALGRPPDLPRVVAAGRALTRRGGYGAFLGVEVSTRDELLAAAAQELARGAELLKVIESGSVDFAAGTVGEPHFTRDDLRAVVALARERGVPVAAHANGPEAVLRAVEAGVDSIEHGILADERALEAMAANGTCWVPTLTPLANLCGDPRWPRLPAVFADHCAAVAAGWTMGVRVIAGSDAGSPGVPHGSLRTELGLLRAAGLPREAVQAAATTAAAALLGLEEGYGSLQAGSRTDLVWFAADPFAAPGGDGGAPAPAMGGLSAGDRLV